MNLVVFRIFGNACYRCRNIVFILNFDEAFVSQNQKCASTVGRIVRNADGCACRDILNLFIFGGVDSHREVYGFESFNQFEFRFFFQGCCQIRSMLHGVGKQLALCQGYVRGYIVGEFDNLNFQALLFSQLFNVVHDFSVRTGGYTDFNRCVRVSLFIGCLVVITAACGDDGQCAKRNGE